MSNKRKGHLTEWKEWARHLRKYYYRKFWKAERVAVKKMIREEVKAEE